MGKADRKMQRALVVLDAAYSDAIRPHRLQLADMSDADARAAHVAALDLARRAADREGGSGWLARTDMDDASLSASLWESHVAPLRSAP
jgi:hypothetical protein